MSHRISLNTCPSATLTTGLPIQNISQALCQEPSPVETVTNENVLISWRRATQQAIPEGWRWGRKGVLQDSLPESSLDVPHDLPPTCEYPTASNPERSHPLQAAGQVDGPVKGALRNGRRALKPKMAPGLGSVCRARKPGPRSPPGPPGPTAGSPEAWSRRNTKPADSLARRVWPAGLGADAGGPSDATLLVLNWNPTLPANQLYLYIICYNETSWFYKGIFQTIEIYPLGAKAVFLKVIFDENFIKMHTGS